MQPDKLLTPNHVGRYMRTRNGSRAGPVEFDPTGFGFGGDRKWRAALGSVRGYYWPTGRVRAEVESPDDIVAEWVDDQH